MATLITQKHFIVVKYWMINKIKISLEFLPSQKVNRKFVSLKGMPVENISLKILSNPW
jgi:hypothetical protein